MRCGVNSLRSLVVRTTSSNTLLCTVSECEASAMLPLECQYLNKSALTTLAGPLTPPVKHFQLKRKPKSATLRAELLQKCECLGHSRPALFSVGFSLWAPSPWNKDSKIQIYIYRHLGCKLWLLLPTSSHLNIPFILI